MKKLIFLITILLGFIAAPALALPPFQFETADVLNLVKITGTMSDGGSTPYTFDPHDPVTASLDLFAFNDSDYGATLPPSSVGMVGNGIGHSTQLEWIGIGLTSFNVGAYDGYVVTLNNDNDDTWQYRLFADDGTNQALGSWQTVTSGNSVTLNLDISTVTGGSGTIGFMAGSNLKEDVMHTSVYIPEPATLLLLGLGSLSLIRVRRKPRA